MELDLSWLLWAIPLAFAGGWLASRYDIRQWRMETRSAPKFYFQGLNHLLNEEQDRAIDAFIEAVQQDPHTTDLHFALGNLFRRRGDHDRAVRVHQHLLQRGDLSAADRERAQHALSLDFLKAGLLDRAEHHLQKLMGTAHQAQAVVALLGLYERTRDWVKALNVAQLADTGQQGSFATRMAHYHCELAHEATERQAHAQAHEHLALALALAPSHARAYLDLAQLLVQTGHTDTAFERLLALAAQAPSALPLAAAQLAQLALALGRGSEAIGLLRAAQQRVPSVDHVEALSTLLPPDAHAEKSALYLDHLRREPSLVLAADWLAWSQAANAKQVSGSGPLEGEDKPCRVPDAVSNAISAAALPLRRYRCAACGFETSTHFWQCPGCQTWDSYSPRRVDEL